MQKKKLQCWFTVLSGGKKSSGNNGFELLSLMRRAKSISILVLSSKSGNQNKLSVYYSGAHVYIEKPYELEECLAQAEALMQLYVELADKDKRCYTLVLGKDLVIDPVSRKVMLKGEVLNLTKKEFELLFCLARHAGQVLSREQLYNHVWNNDNSYNVDNLIKAHIKTLRKNYRPPIRSISRMCGGIGYRFEDDNSHIINGCVK